MDSKNAIDRADGRRYGIGAGALCKLWIERERQIVYPDGDMSQLMNNLSPTQSVRCHTISKMRRELQEAMNLVVDPETIVKTKI